MFAMQIYVLMEMITCHHYLCDFGYIMQSSRLPKNAMTSNVQHFSLILMPQNYIVIQSMPPNVNVRVGIEMTSPMCKYVTIRVIDRGMGIQNINQAFGFAQSSMPK